MTWMDKGNTFNEALEVIDHFFTKSWSDGLPVMPPTEDRINKMLDGTGLAADLVLGEIPPLGGVLSVRDLAAHAVMAGCLPSYMPVLVAAVKALLMPKFNLLGVQATTHNCSPLTIVGGLVVDRIQMNSGANVFGPGNRANATIGRAIRLVLLNVGGGIPEKGDKATLGHPGKYTYCIAENAAVSPWPALHRYLGAGTPDGVTVFACEAPHSIATMGKGALILDSIASAMSTLSNNNTLFAGQMLVIFGIDHAAVLHREGWPQKEVQMYLHEKARVSMKAIFRLGDRCDNLDSWPRWVIESHLADPDYRVPVVRYPEDILMTVAGGQGPFSVILPGWGFMGGFACPASIEQPLAR